MSQVFDEALERLRGTGTEVAGRGAPNHGPMAAEALTVLGREDVVVGWADRYRQRLQAMPTPTSPVTGETWREALGAIHRVGDWAAFFRAQLTEAPLADGLRRVDRPSAAGDPGGRGPRVASDRTRAARPGPGRDAITHRGTRGRPGVLGRLLPATPRRPAPRGIPRLEPGTGRGSLLPAWPGATGHAEGGLPPCDGRERDGVLGCRLRPSRSRTP
jgi:hypothetical protein